MGQPINCPQVPPSRSKLSYDSLDSKIPHSMYSSLVPYIKERLSKHHELYSGKCKAEYWEENLAYALKKSGYGTDWNPDFNHKIGLDQTTSCGIRIGNKSGNIEKDTIEISGSRLTKHKTFEEKLNFLSIQKEDYIFCLGTESKDWDNKKLIYYFVVIDSKKLDYHKQTWREIYGNTKNNLGTVTGWSCINENYSAKISRSMSDQLWTKIKLDYCDEIYDIVL